MNKPYLNVKNLIAILGMAAIAARTENGQLFFLDLTQGIDQAQWRNISIPVPIEETPTTEKDWMV